MQCIGDMGIIRICSANYVRCCHLSLFRGRRGGAGVCHKWVISIRYNTTQHNIVLLDCCCESLHKIYVLYDLQCRAFGSELSEVSRSRNIVRIVSEMSRLIYKILCSKSRPDSNSEI